MPKSKVESVMEKLTGQEKYIAKVSAGRTGEHPQQKEITVPILDVIIIDDNAPDGLQGTEATYGFITEVAMQGMAESFVEEKDDKFVKVPAPRKDREGNLRSITWVSL